MGNILLSRRVAKLMKTDPILDMGFAAREDMAQAVERAKTFKDLPVKYQTIIKRAEASTTKKKGKK